jgi:hypothetical protein
MKLVIALAAAAAFFTVYLFWVRPYLKSLPSLAAAWRAEETAWDAIKAWLDGRKTILAGVWGEIIGFAPDLLQIVSGVDLKTALSLPDNWALLISGMVVPTLMLIFRAKARV